MVFAGQHQKQRGEAIICSAKAVIQHINVGASGMRSVTYPVGKGNGIEDGRDVNDSQAILTLQRYADDDDDYPLIT